MAIPLLCLIDGPEYGAGPAPKQTAEFAVTFRAVRLKAEPVVVNRASGASFCPAINKPLTICCYISW
jgi:hypothetical protein